MFSQAEPDRMLDASIYDFHYHNSYVNSIYNRGAVFLDTLRSQVGPAEFDDFIHELYQTGAFRIIASSDFFGALAEHAQVDTSTTVGWFFAGEPFGTALAGGNSSPSSPPSTDSQPAGPRRVKEWLDE